MQPRETVEYDRPKLERLKKALAETAHFPGESFTFEGREYLRSYARYLIEYLETQLPKD